MDEKQLQRAVDQYSPMLYRIAMALLGKPEDAEDALQNAFLRYYRRAPQFQSDEHEKAWLIRCTVQAAKNMRVVQKRHSHEELSSYHSLPQPETGLPELLFYLSAEDRVLLQLRYVEGYSAEEIALLRNKSAATIRKQLERARKRARIIYEKEFV